MNSATGMERIREEVQHVRQLGSENQKALMSIVRAVSQMQEQVRQSHKHVGQRHHRNLLLFIYTEQPVTVC